MSDYPRILDCVRDYCAQRRPECKVCDDLFWPQYDSHVKEFRFRQRTGLMVLQPAPFAPAQTC